MRVGVVQMRSTDALEANLEAAAARVAECAERGAEWVALPENFAYMRREGEANPHAQSLDGPIVRALAALARRNGVWLLGGTFPERVPDDPKRVYNTSPLLSPEGELRAVYRKIHLFDVDLSGQGAGAFRESDAVAPGSEVVAAETPFGGVGLSVCYDLRFPELYRALAARGVRFLAVPSAFARPTGRDHWEVLLRARAIEGQCFVVAPAQWGEHGPDRASYGRAMVVDPWGLVLATAPDRPCALVVDCDLEHQDRIRASLPALAHRRL